MATRLLNTIGKIGLGIAVVGGVAQTALYNGEYYFIIIVNNMCTNVFVYQCRFEHICKMFHTLRLTLVLLLLKEEDIVFTNYCIRLPLFFCSTHANTVRDNVISPLIR